MNYTDETKQSADTLIEAINNEHFYIGSVAGKLLQLGGFIRQSNMLTAVCLANADQANIKNLSALAQQLSDVQAWFDDFEESAIGNYTLLSYLVTGLIESCEQSIGSSQNESADDFAE